MFLKNYLLLILFFGLLGCSTTEEFFDDITDPDYVNSSKARRLEVPPDLSELEADTTFSIPGEAKSYKDYLDREEQIANMQDDPNRKRIIEKPEGLKIIKSGNLRWLLVDKDPNTLWPHIKDFWEELGFRVLIANKKTGIIETEWMDTDDIKLDRADGGALSRFDKWLDSLSGFADKRKFRTRVEFGENESTEIYISQRSAEAAADQHARILRERTSEYNVGTIYKIEEYKSNEDSGKKKVEVSEQRDKDDYEIDSELLTRLMIKLGATNYDAKLKVENPEVIIKSSLNISKNDAYIQMFDQYERAWRRLGLALDIIGFVTEDKNRSEGIYYVRFSQEQLPSESKKEEEGLIDSLIFWDHDEKKEEDQNQENKTENLSQQDQLSSDDTGFTGIEAPEIKPIDEDYFPEEFVDDQKVTPGNEETWVTKLWPSWGDKEEKHTLPDNEKRYRIRIKPASENTTLVYIDYSNGKKNLSSDAQKVLKIINEYLK